MITWIIKKLGFQKEVKAAIPKTRLEFIKDFQGGEGGVFINHILVFRLVNRCRIRTMLKLLIKDLACAVISFLSPVKKLSPVALFLTIFNRLGRIRKNKAQKFIKCMHMAQFFLKIIFANAFSQTV